MNLTVAARKDIEFLTSTGAEWPVEADYRPPGWTSLKSPAQVGELAAKIAKARKKGEPHGLDDDLAREVELHAAILRQCWVTPKYVWRLAELLIGPVEVDPFWNVWAHTHQMHAGVRLLDGKDGRNGFDVSLWGSVVTPLTDHPTRPRTANVNGPHDDAGAYVAACVLAASLGHRVAAVVALDGCGWFAGNTDVTPKPRLEGAAEDNPECVRTRADVSSCDVLAVPEGGRMSFEGPPGINPSSPTKGYALALWGVPDEVYGALWGSSPQAVRVVGPDGRRWILYPGCGDAGAVGEPRDLATLLGAAKTT